MVVLRLGGVYADVDTECKKPLDNLIQPRDTMIVSWENEFSTAQEAGLRQYVRKRQVNLEDPLHVFCAGGTASQACHLLSHATLSHAATRSQGWCAWMSASCTTHVPATCATHLHCGSQTLKLIAAIHVCISAKVCIV